MYIKYKMYVALKCTFWWPCLAVVTFLGGDLIITIVLYFCLVVQMMVMLMMRTITHNENDVVITHDDYNIDNIC